MGGEQTGRRCSFEAGTLHRPDMPGRAALGAAAAGPPPLVDHQAPTTRTFFFVASGAGSTSPRSQRSIRAAAEGTYGPREVTPVKLMPESAGRHAERRGEQENHVHRVAATTVSAFRSRDVGPVASLKGDESRPMPKRVTFDDTAKPASPMSLMSLCQTPNELPPLAKSARTEWPGRPGSPAASNR
eukprot:CAMPEP_0175613902 /NCGR_PEP_ID=MMETSP0096-20121207/64578_1 /TAXON_ID=311494 /ORGANISM="Alexandrium monilatum, Strain CCMP3105" /LENGTH=185 /DNA_ID=CAMNT_0016918993 /DNA_START=33 /DNA_END=588 /DNA_ORIENTATION=-